MKSPADLKAKKLRNEEIKQEKARRGLFDFIKYTKSNYKKNWHNVVLCSYLDEFLNNPEFNRLMVFMGPRHGKSEIVSRRLPAYLFGKNPNINIIACSYSADLAQRMNRDVQRIIDTKKYAEVFPDTRLSGANVRTVAQGSYLRNSDIFEIVGHFGSYRGAGVGGGITGMGFDIGIIDDPYKNWQEANSVTVQKAVWEWYTTTFYTRAEKDAKILITLTRWHDNDLAGKLIKQMKEDPEAEQWTVLNFPSIFEGQEEFTVPEDKREVGQAIWPWKYDKKKLLKSKKTLGSYLFAAMHQGKPAPPEGGILKRTWWKYYKELPSKFDEVIQSWDCAFKDTKGSAYVVGQVWGRIGADKYLIDQVRDKMDFPATVQAVRKLSAKWPSARVKLIEDKANGPAVIATLKREISGIIPVNPEGGKLVRAHAVSGDIESGNAFLPDKSLAPWVDDFVNECAAFPNSTYADQVDAMTQALNRLSSTGGCDNSITSVPMKTGYNDYHSSSGRNIDILNKKYTDFNSKDLWRY